MSKILYLTNIPSPYAVDLFNGIGEKFDLTVIYERKKALTRDDKWVNKDERKFKEIYLKGLKIGDESSLCIDILKYLTKEIYDLIIISNYSAPTAMIAIEYLKFKGIPFYLHADGGIITGTTGLKYKLKKHLIGAARGYFSSGEKTDEYFKVYGNGIAPIYRYPFTSIKNADIVSSVLTREQKLKLREQLGFNKKIINKNIIISIGRIIYSKGYDILIEAASQIDQDIQYIIIGGQPTENLTQMINMHKLDNIHFIDFIEHDKISNYLKASDLFVLPTRSDVWGLVVNEAMASGLPVITTNMCVGGVELVDDSDNGYIVDVDNTRQLSDAITKYFSLTDSEKEEFQKKALNKIKEYTLENMIEVYCKHISDILNRN